MERAEYSDTNCSVGRALELVGDRWTMLILREAFFGVRRFEAMQRNLGIARNVLTDRLHKLVAHGILSLEQYQERPARHEYRLTEKGLGLYAPIVTLMAWGDEHLADPEGPPLVLRHAACGCETTPTLTCACCGEPLDPRGVQPAPGPGARARTTA